MHRKDFYQSHLKENILVVSFFVPLGIAKIEKIQFLLLVFLFFSLLPFLHVVAQSADFAPGLAIKQIEYFLRHLQSVREDRQILYSPQLYYQLSFHVNLSTNGGYEQ